MSADAKIGTGIDGLDEVLGGGFPPNRVYLVQGDPGVGKTTLALQFLREGVRLGERTLYVTLSETKEELAAVAKSHRWMLDGIEIYEMPTTAAAELGNDDNTLYLPSEVELGERMRDLLEALDRVKPQRMVIDSCSELRLLAQTPLRFRRQIMSLKSDLVSRGCTILLLDNPQPRSGDVLLQSLVHGVIDMEQLSPVYGAERRRLRVQKLREVSFRGGYHDLTIAEGGLNVFPRLVAAEHHSPFLQRTLSSGLASLDLLVGGGLDFGTSALFIGPSGSGKSVLATRFAASAAERGDGVAMFAFDEGTGTLFARAAELGMDLRPYVERNRISVQQIDPAELAPGQFVHLVRHAVEERKARVVVIDSLNGYLHAMPEERFVVTQMHELLSYLRQQGVVAIVVVSQVGLLGQMTSPLDVSYLADTILLFRFFEDRGKVRKALSVMKRRSGRHEETIRELSMTRDGIVVGEPLHEFQGVLTGVPELFGGSARTGKLE